MPTPTPARIHRTPKRFQAITALLSDHSKNLIDFLEVNKTRILESLPNLSAAEKLSLYSRLSSSYSDSLTNTTNLNNELPCPKDQTSLS